MIHDKKVIACCGETSIANAKQSLTTMMQVSLASSPGPSERFGL